MHGGLEHADGGRLGGVGLQPASFGSARGYPKGDVRWPILSVDSMRTLVPLRNRLSRLNQAMVAMYLRVVVVPNVPSKACRVSSVSVPDVRSSSVAAINSR